MHGVRSFVQRGFDNLIISHAICMTRVFSGTRATVKAGTQERGTERGTEVMWFHTGNYTEMMQLESCKSTAILRKPSSLSLKNFWTDLETSFH